MPSGCDDIRADLVAYLDAELDPAARAAVERHLAACAACRRERDLFAATGAILLREAPPAGPRAGFEERLAARLGALRRRGRIVRLSLAGAALAASIAIAAAGIPFLRARLAGPPPEPPGAIAQLDPAVEAEIIAKLDVLENMELVENIDLVDDDEAFEDPLSGIEEGGKG
jgi:hypothetical protein